MKKLSKGDLDNIIEQVTSSKSATRDQKLQFAAVARCDKQVMKDITELILKKIRRRPKNA